MTDAPDRYGTHLPLLLAAVARTSGPVLELGCGTRSTPALHEACRGRRLVSLETDPGWFKQFARFARDGHELHWGQDYDQWQPLYRLPWDVVLIDHAPAERRAIEAARLIHARYLILHDTEDAEDGYGWAKLLAAFLHTWTDKRATPWTTVASNVGPVDDLLPTAS